MCPSVTPPSSDLVSFPGQLSNVVTEVLPISTPNVPVLLATDLAHLCGYAIPA